MTLSPALADLVRAAGLEPPEVAELARRVLQEDLRGGVDVTSVATVPADQEGIADVVARAAGVVAGLPVAAAVFERAGVELGRQVSIAFRAGDGDAVLPGQPLLTVVGPTRTLLTAERGALNLLQHLSGVATLTRRWVDAIAGTKARVLDTRKTLPGLRDLQKYAVRQGGGAGYRMGLSDAAMVKDNHVLAAGGVVAAYRAVRAAYPGVPVEVECDTVEQVRAVVDAGADLVLLDNMDLDDMRAAVRLAAGRARLEASGGLTLERARAVAETGVDYLSVGALTHSAPALDLAFDLRPKGGS